MMKKILPPLPQPVPPRFTPRPEAVVQSAEQDSIPDYPGHLWARLDGSGARGAPRLHPSGKQGVTSLLQVEAVGK